MSELMGILDALEALIQSASRLPLTDKIVIEEFKLMQIVNKLRLAVQSGESMIRRSIEVGQDFRVEDKVKEKGDVITPEFNALPMIQDAMNKAEQIRSGANDYAQDVLSNLQLTVAKMHKEITKMERNIEKGRDVLQQQRVQILTTKETEFHEV